MSAPKFLKWNLSAWPCF